MPPLHAPPCAATALSVTVAYSRSHYNRRRRRRALYSGTAVVGSKLFACEIAENTATAPVRPLRSRAESSYMVFPFFRPTSSSPSLLSPTSKFNRRTTPPHHVRVFANHLPGTATTRSAKQSSPLARDDRPVHRTRQPNRRSCPFCWDGREKVVSACAIGKLLCACSLSVSSTTIPIRP